MTAKGRKTGPWGVPHGALTPSSATQAIRTYMAGLERGDEPQAHAELERRWNPEGRIDEVEAGRRDQIQLDVGFATLTSESLALVLEHVSAGRVIDVGAGEGHLARVLAANGVQTIAIDHVTGHRDHAGTTVTRALAGPWLDENLGPEDTPLVCWPPRQLFNPKAEDPGLAVAGRLRPGQAFIYIGGPPGSRTGTTAFHECVGDGFEEIGLAPVAPMLAHRGRNRMQVLRKKA